MKATENFADDHFRNILRLCNVSLSFLFNASEAIHNYLL